MKTQRFPFSALLLPILLLLLVFIFFVMPAYGSLPNGSPIRKSAPETSNLKSDQDHLDTSGETFVLDVQGERTLVSMLPSRELAIKDGKSTKRLGVIAYTAKFLSSGEILVIDDQLALRQIGPQGITTILPPHNANAPLFVSPDERRVAYLKPSDFEGSAATPHTNGVAVLDLTTKQSVLLFELQNVTVQLYGWMNNSLVVEVPYWSSTTLKPADQITLGLLPTNRPSKSIQAINSLPSLLPNSRYPHTSFDQSHIAYESAQGVVVASLQHLSYAQIPGAKDPQWTWAGLTVLRNGIRTLAQQDSYPSTAMPRLNGNLPLPDADPLTQVDAPANPKAPQSILFYRPVDDNIPVSAYYDLDRRCGYLQDWLGHTWQAPGCGGGFIYGRTYDNHEGTDYDGLTGDPIWAPAVGTVDRRSISCVNTYPDGPATLGTFVRINHGVMSDGNSYHTEYGHLDCNASVVGIGTQIVTLPYQIADMGNTGYSSGPHMHFNVYKNGTSFPDSLIDPYDEAIISGAATLTPTPGGGTPTYTPTPTTNQFFCVDDDGGLVGSPCVNSVAYTTIQAAVNAASENDEIRIATGIYDSSVTINTSLTLKGGYAGGAGGWSSPGGSNLTIHGGATTANANIAIENLTLNGGLTGSGVATAYGSVNWTGGYLYNNLTIPQGAVFNISGDSNKYLDGNAVLNNMGTVVWTGTGEIRQWYNGTGRINNSGLFDVQNNAQVSCAYCGYATIVFNNNGGGTFRKSAGSETTFTGNAQFNNNGGVVNIMTGTLYLAGGGINWGNFNVASNATVNFASNPAYTFDDNSELVGEGTCIVSGGVIISGTANLQNLQLHGGGITINNGTLNAQNFTMSSGYLAGSGNLSATSTMNWTGGYLLGTLNIPAGAVLNIGGDSNKYLDGNAVLNNMGTVMWTGTGEIRQWYSGTGRINNSGLFDVQNNAQVSCAYCGYATIVFNNNVGGVFRKSAGSESTFGNGAQFNNNGGVVNIMTGTLSLAGGGTNNSNFNISSNATVSFGNLTYTFNDNSVLAGEGTGVVNGSVIISGTANLQNLQLHGGGVTVNGTMNAQNFTMSSGYLNGAGNLSATSTMNWTGGYLLGTLNIPAGAVLNISGDSNKYLDGNAVLNNMGTVMWTGTGHILQWYSGTGRINNSGLFDVQNNAQVSCAYCGYASIVFNNIVGGVFRKSAGSETTFTSNAQFNNGGVVSVIAGTLAFYGGFTQAIGTTNLNGGNIYSNYNINIQGGSIEGSGTINASVNNYGSISPGASPGALTINGNLWQAPTATLNIEIGGLNPGSQHDQLIVNGSATLDGALNITTANGYTPNISDTFQILNYTSRNGSFATVNGLDLPNARVYTPAYNPTNLTLTVAQTAALVGHVTWQGRPAQPHALQQLPVTLTLKLGATEVNYSALTTDASGYFTVSVGSVPTGTYQWRVDGPKYLANAGTVALEGLNVTRLQGSGVSNLVTFQPSNLVTQVEMGLLRAGDANDDNIVSVQDFNILKPAFGRAIGEPAYDDRADFTGDQVVSVLDFNLVKLNFGLPGAPPLRPGGP